jgi:hydroxyethylthiazole kinase-like uncharacterized protein yjeF
VIPILTPDEMRAVDAAAAEPTDVLVERAGAAVARAAADLLGGRYGRRVVVVAGKGNNGADGRAAARRLVARGASVQVVDAAAVSATSGLPGADLVIDAAYGTGFRGSFDFPDTGGTPVLAVDIPSGVDGVTGIAAGRPAEAIRTVTFAALKPGLLFADGRRCAGEVEVADIGLDVSGARGGRMTDEDGAAWFPRRASTAHKWRHAVWVVGGSPGMTGAPTLAARAALRTASGYARLSVPGGASPEAGPLEVVGTPLSASGWSTAVAQEAGRFGALVVGPGLGPDPLRAREAVEVALWSPAPVVVDGDGLRAVAASWVTFPADRPTVLTPHDGEYEAFASQRVGADRMASARWLAREREAVVLLKGPTSVVATPDGRAAVITSGDQRLATAGTGDVLSGMVASLLAAGLDGFEAAAVGAHLHGRAAAEGWATGFMAGDLPDLVPAVVARWLER